MKKISLFLFVFLSIGCSEKVSNSFPIACDRDNSKGAGHSTYGLVVPWSC